jgi:NAD(P)-dependent dehydrogenase (short-subunit alcohol dehydrogenase family)
MVFALLQAETTILNTILAMSSSRVVSSDHARYITGQTLVVDGGATVVGSERRTQ